MTSFVFCQVVERAKSTATSELDSKNEALRLAEQTNGKKWQDLQAASGALHVQLKEARKIADAETSARVIDQMRDLEASQKKSLEELERRDQQAEEGDRCSEREGGLEGQGGRDVAG